MKEMIVSILIAASLICGAALPTEALIFDPNPIVFTESPNSTLTVTHAGMNFGTTTFIGPYNSPPYTAPEAWGWVPPSSPIYGIVVASGSPFTSLTWAEPENPNTYNWFNPGLATPALPPTPLYVIVASDSTFVQFPDLPIIPNGGTTPIPPNPGDYALALTYILNFPSGPVTEVAYQATFFDLGDVAPVPEPSTMLLVGSGLCGFAALRCRKFKK